MVEFIFTLIGYAIAGVIFLYMAAGILIIWVSVLTGIVAGVAGIVVDVFKRPLPYLMLAGLTFMIWMSLDTPLP